MNDTQPEKMPVMHLYLDETGPFHPDRQPDSGRPGLDWFAYGGIIMNEEDITPAKALHSALLSRWPSIQKPLHLTDIRAWRKGFTWLGKLTDAEQDRFWSDYKTTLAALPVTGAACVIDRPGYRARGYGRREGDQKWMLCRSAFAIVVERSAKFALRRGRRLRVFFERSNEINDSWIAGYFKNLKTGGLEFDKANSAKYAPLTEEDFQKALISIEGKDKTNKMIQFADGYIYAMARGAYDKKFDLYRRLLESGKLVNSQVPGNLAPTMGIKHYCFDLVHQERQTKKAGD